MLFLKRVGSGDNEVEGGSGAGQPLMRGSQGRGGGGGGNAGGFLGAPNLRAQTFENPQDWPHNLNDQGLANVHQVFKILTDAATGRSVGVSSRGMAGSPRGVYRQE